MANLKFIYFYLIASIFFCILSRAQIPQVFPNFPKNYDTSNRSADWAEGLPIVADFQGDGQREIAVGSDIFNYGVPRVYLIDINGNILPGWPKEFQVFGRFANIMGTAAGDMNHDGKIDLVALTKDSLYVLDYSGNNLTGFPVSVPGTGYSVFCLSLYDLENNGSINIVLAADDYIYVFDNNGHVKSGWPKKINGVFWGGITVGDIAGDGKGEIIASSSCRELGPGCDSNYFYVFDRNGNYFPGWPVFSDSMYSSTLTAIVLQRDSLSPVNSTIYSITTQPPVNPFNTPVNSRITEYDIHGTIKSRFYHTSSDYLFTPVIADILGNGNLEIATGEQEHQLFLYYTNGNLVSGWPQNGSDAFSNQLCVGKVQYGNFLDIITPRQAMRLDAYNFNGAEIPGWPLFTLGGISGLAFSDINQDGSVEMLAVGTYGAENALVTALNVYTIPGIPFTKENFPWPMFAHDRYRTNQLGFVPPDEPIGIKQISLEIPGKFMLYQNYPDPFNPSTTIKFDVPVKASVSLEIYDITGRQVMHSDYAFLQPGEYKMDWSAEKFASGVYFYRIFVQGLNRQYTAVKKMVLLK